MDQITFWALIDKTRQAANGDPADQAKLLAGELAQLPLEEIQAFEAIHCDLSDEAYLAYLWEAAFVIWCGCSDDGFMDFRDWLIGRGQQAFQNALADPESLLDIAVYGEGNMYPTLLGVERRAYELATGQELPHTFRDRPELTGKLRDQPDRVAQFPKLAAKFYRRWLADEGVDQP